MAIAVATAAVTVAPTSGVGATVTFGVTGLASPPHAPIIATRNMKAVSFIAA